MNQVRCIFFVIFFSSYLYCQSFPYPLPLKCGNYWNYVDIIGGNDTKFTFSVVDSEIVINNNFYYKVALVFSIYNPPGYIYLRYDAFDNFYKEYRHQAGLPPPDGWLESGEYLYYKKNAEKGFMWKEALDTTVDSRHPFFYHFVKDTGTISIFGKNVLVKYIETTDSTIYGSGEWWTEEFGLIKYNDEGMNAYLVGCVIDGIAYGDTTTVGVKDENEHYPKDFYLSQNFPNPFNPITSIKYSIPQFSNVEIKIYDLLGKEIATLINQEQNSGTYYVEFNGCNLSSGLYLYRIKAGNFTQAKKMYLLK